MKLKKMLSITIITIIILSVIFTIMPNKASAATSLYLGLIAKRDGEIGYAISDPNHGGAKLWKILEYTGTESSAGLKANGYKDIYCLKEGFGFSPTTKKVEYDLPINMKSPEAKGTADSEGTIESTISVLKPLVKGTISKGGKTINRYNALLALGDLMYLSGDSAESRTAYLDAAGIREGEAWAKMITDNDIEAVQQAAVWYFTNYGDATKDYDKTDDNHWLNYTTDGSTYQSLANYYQIESGANNREGVQRQEQAEILYNYLINQAIQNADSYEDATKLGAPAILNTTILNYEESGSNYIVGPIKITEQSGNVIPYTIDLDVKVNGTLTTTGYRILKENKATEIQKSGLKELAKDGSNFYISVPKNNVTSVSVHPKINYTNTTLTLWTATSGPNVEQPVMIPERQPVTGGQELVVTPNQAPFDLALRKYITKIDDTVLANDTSTTRVPSITEGTIATEKTATYKHRKDPVVVKTGTIVTYEITIYNEGDKAGRATKIVDQLPTGLEFVEVTNGNFELDSYDKTGDNTLKLKRKSSNEENLNAYTAGHLDSETIEITCKVVAKPDQNNNKILTNVAWISEEYDAVSGTTITNQKNADRDSEPSTTPKVDKNSMENYRGDTNNNKVDLSDKDYFYKGEQDDDDFEKLILLPESFDLALRKYITKVNDTVLADDANTTRIPSITEGTIATEKTATYKHRKDPVIIKTDDIVTYEITIYNEGEKAGRTTKIVDQLPEGLEFVDIISGNFELDSYDKTENNTLNLKRKASNEENLDAYKEGKLDSETIEITCKVSRKADENKNTILTNVAWISEEYDAVSETTITNQKGADRDSEPSTKPNVNKDNMDNYKGNSENQEDLTDKNYFYKGEQDDDDFEKLILLPESFDLKLIKNITEVNKQTIPERLLGVDVSKLNTLDDKNNVITTAEYKMSKEPVGVKKGDIVTYRLRVYNEALIDGYASEITEEIPEGLEFIWSEKEGTDLKNDTELTEEEKEAIAFNQKYLWGNFKYNESKDKIIQVSTRYLDIYEGQPEPDASQTDTRVKSTKNLIKAFDKTKGYVDTETERNPDYREVYIKMRVISEDGLGTIIKNEACITDDSDSDGNPVDDRDSKPEDWKEHPNHEDDEDHDYVVLQSFDLALRKFIIAVSKDEKVEDNEYLKNDNGSYTRAPIVDTSKLNTIGEDEKLITTAIYKHSKEPVLVQKGDTVIYMLRVYNEGDMDGYAAEIKDHLPSTLEFVNGEFNKKYGWVASEDGRTLTTTYLKDSKIAKAEKNKDGEYVLTYKEVPVMCKVKDTAPTSTNLVNLADITVYEDENKQPVTDRDSVKDNVKTPEEGKWPEYNDGKTDEYIPGQEDDDDFDRVIIKEFDLALRKWVTQAIVTDAKGTTVTNTGHKPYDDPEQVVKVELHRKKINEVTVKFRYSIRIINEGEIAGYAKEITDYVPKGLKFVAGDNQGWTDEGNNVISTRLLENKLLQPGEYADVEVVLTWINNKDNMGVKTNIAEISEDYNDYNVPDKDSTPDNQKPGEDDIDDAPVMLSVATGRAKTYFLLGFIVLVTLAGGLGLIKKYVL